MTCSTCADMITEFARRASCLQFNVLFRGNSQQDLPVALLARLCDLSTHGSSAFSEVCFSHCICTFQILADDMARCKDATQQCQSKRLSD